MTSGEALRGVESVHAAFKRPPPQRSKNAGGPNAKPRLPVALIFACLVVVYTGFRYFWR